MKTFIDEKQVENLQQAADLADEYFLTHGNFNQQRNQSSDKQYTANPSSGSDFVPAASEFHSIHEI